MDAGFRPRASSPGPSPASRERGVRSLTPPLPQGERGPEGEGRGGGGGAPRRPRYTVATFEDTEIELLLEAVFHHYGYDFRDYAFSSLRRRLRLLMLSEGLSTIT